MKPIVLVLAPMLLLVLAVSGCTIPGTDITIPIPGLGGGTTDYTHDIIIIKSMQAVPATTIKAGQTLTLYADLQNMQDPERAAGSQVEDIEIELYDYCTNLFTGEPKPNEDCSKKFDMSPQEIKTCSWELTPREDLMLITPCELKVKVTYEHSTKTVTSITFIDSDELGGRIRRGEPWQIGGSTTRGYGPVKTYLEVETQQPVPDADSGEGASASISMKIRNVGQGYIKDSAIIADDDHFSIKLPDELDWKDNEKCMFETQKIKIDGSDTDVIKIIRKESTPKFCKIGSPYVEIEQTYDMNAEVTYDYEFRKNIRIQIEPR